MRGSWLAVILLCSEAVGADGVRVRVLEAEHSRADSGGSISAISVDFWFMGRSAVLFPQPTPFSARIPAADPEKYGSVRDAKDWANPYPIVTASGVEVISKTIPSGPQDRAPGSAQ